MKKTIAAQAKKYTALFKSSLITFGKTKVDLVVAGFREMRYLMNHDRVNSQYPEYKAYIEELYYKAEQATLELVGINWDGKIMLRDSPHGTRLKFIASISVDGPKEVEVNSILFHPYWDSIDVALNEAVINIKPHQSYVKEFLIETERSYLEARNRDSLSFSVEIMYGQVPLRFTNKVPVWDKPELHVNLEPNFYFVKPFPEVDIDKVVANLNVKVIISKPYDYSGPAKIDFTTPMGLYAGAYRQDIQLTAGTLNETVRIPFTISSLFELGTQLQIVHLKIDNDIVDSDTSKIRIASCNIPDTRKIGYLPDENGRLEDILSMTDAAYRPLTDRTLVKGDIEAYDVIVIGTNSYKRYESFSKLKDRFETYLKQGGSIVILPQSPDWPNDALPVSFAPLIEYTDNESMTNRIEGANVLSKPYKISVKNLLSSYYKKREVYPALIAPSEKVYITKSGAALLSVTRIGDGQIIFCGFPLLDMIADLNIEAIHLFANLLNY